MKNFYYVAKHLYRYGIYVAEKERKEHERPISHLPFDDRDDCIKHAWFKIAKRITGLKIE